jgi:hypothetical protein
MLWLMPMKQVAAHYDATHHQLKVFCTKYGIPTPPSVYSLNPGQQPPPFVGISHSNPDTAYEAEASHDHSTELSG